MRSLLLLAFLLVGCSESVDPQPPPPELSIQPVLTNGADSLAWRITQAAGGLDAWNALPRLRFDWAVVRDSSEVFRAKHLWNRVQNRYRVEYPVGEDSILVALFAPSTFDMEAPEGSVFINGRALDSLETTERLTSAYERHINDAYWLLAPLKLFDPGARRALAPDSSDADTEVLLLTFENVGLTPGDQYWLRADSTGRMVAWTFLLEGNAGGPASRFSWSDYTSLDTPRGPLILAQRLARDNRAILTQPFPADSLGDDLFSDPTPRL